MMTYVKGLLEASEGSDQYFHYPFGSYYKISVLSKFFGGSTSVSKRFQSLLALTGSVFFLFVILYRSSPHNYSIDIHAGGQQIPSVALQKEVDWSRFAYVQYVTNSDYLCNSVMVFEALNRLDCKAEMVLMYPNTWEIGSGNDSDSDPKIGLLLKARDEYGAHLAPIEVQHSSGQEPTWADSFTKLLAFNQTQYDRVLSLDSDSTVLQCLDELFALPQSAVAMPRAYWLDPKDHVLSSQLMLVQPSEAVFERVDRMIQQHAQNDFDMEIVNDLFGDSCIILPHRSYDLLTGEFFPDRDHSPYLGSPDEIWEPDQVLEQAKFVHFSDWPYPKPWIKTSEQQTRARMPPCKNGDCRDQKIWLWLYEDFARRREMVCGSSYAPKG